MRLQFLTVLCVGLAASGCGGADVAIPEAEFAPRGWELAHEPEDLQTWREGTLRRVDARPGEEFGDLVPAEGATLELLATRPDGHPPLEVVATTTVGADGRFRVGPGPADGWIIRASLDGYATSVGGRASRFPAVFELPDGDVVFGLREACPFEVVVRNEDGSPAAGATIRAESAAYMQDVVSDENGHAHFEAPPGPVMVRAIDPDRDLASEFTELPLPAETPPLVLTTRQRPPVQGRVVDAETGAPLAGAVVLRVDDATLRTRTDAEGRFELVSRLGGRVAAFARGYGWRSAWIMFGEEPELRLYAGRTVRGRVEGPDGEPVAGARVFAVATTPDDATERVFGPVTGSDGSFVFDWVPPTPDGAADPVLSAHRRRLGWSAGTTLPEEGAEIVLRLSGERTVSGAVTRASGAREAGVPVHIELEAPGLSTREATILGMPVDVYVDAGADGSYQASNIPAHMSGVVRFDVSGAEFALELEEGTEDAEASLELTDGKAIAGRIVDVNGDPVLRSGTVLVDVMNHPRYDRLVREIALEDDGTFRFEDLPEGMFGVRARVRGYDVGGAVVTAGVEDLELIAEIPAPLDFDVRFPVGVDPGRVEIRLHDATDPAARIRTATIEPGSDALTASLPLVRRGRYHIVAHSGVWWVRLRDVEIPDGFRPPVVLEMERTHKIDVNVLDADGRPRTGSRVRVMRLGQQGALNETFWSGEGGVAQVTGLVPGEHLLRIVEEGRPITEVRVTVPEGGDGAPESVDLTFPPFGSVAVTIDPEQRRRGGLVLAVRRLDGARPSVDGPGAFEKGTRFRVPSTGPVRLTGVEAGPIELTLTREAEEIGRRRVDVAADAETPVRLP